MENAEKHIESEHNLKNIWQDVVNETFCNISCMDPNKRLN